MLTGDKFDYVSLTTYFGLYRPEAPPLGVRRFYIFGNIERKTFVSKSQRLRE
jgi:hypothetical protein